MGSRLLERLYLASARVGPVNVQDRWVTEQQRTLVGTALPLLLLQCVELQSRRGKSRAVASTQGSRLSLPAWSGWLGASQVPLP